MLAPFDRDFVIFKFIHAADIHLDSPLRGLERYDGAPIEQIRMASRRALENLVALAIREQVNFVLIAGDLYDGDWKDYQTGLFFIQQVVRLREAKIPLFLIAGNHDASNKMTRSLSLPDNVTFFSPESPETRLLPEINVAIHGQSFLTSEVIDDLSSGYPAPVKNHFNIGMLHTSLDGREGHDPYAPCTLEGLKLKGYDYWALGHIHQREILFEDPFIAFPGNIQGRHIRETGRKGCYLVKFEAGLPLQVNFCSLDVMRWDRLTIDVSEVNQIDDCLDLIGQRLRDARELSEGLPLAVRVELIGRSKIHRQLQSDREHWINQIRGLAIDAGMGSLWIEKIQFFTDELASERDHGFCEGSLSELQELFSRIRQNPKLLNAIGFDFSKITGRLPNELGHWGSASGSPGFEEDFGHILDEAESLLMQRLLRPSFNSREKGSE